MSQLPPTVNSSPPYKDVLEALRKIWSEVLESPVEDPDQDFFELGGDSLLALVVARQAQDAGFAMPPSGVLRRPTLRLLTEAVLDSDKFETW
ncbi:acyl carrier protein [Streptomyces sp. NPDC001840]